MKKFLYKLVIFILIVASLQVILVQYILAPIPEVKLLDKYLQEKYQVIYFGDSVLQYTDVSDTDKSGVVKMLSKINPSVTIADMSFSAYDAGVYEAMMKYISRSPYKPEAIIIPIGLRSFSPEWDSRPVYQFEKQKFILSAPPLLADFWRPLAIFGVIKENPISDQQFFNTPVYYEKTQIGAVLYFENDELFASTSPENIRNKYVYSYMGSLSPDHRKLKSLENLLDSAKEQGITVYVYITPLDYEGGQEFVGPDFMVQTKVNVDLICSIVLAKNVPCLNLAFSLGSEYFSHPVYPSEHLRQAGRQFIAEKVNEFFFKK